MTGEVALAAELIESSDDELGRLDIDLDRKSKQHNLTSSHVRAILHVSVSHTLTQTRTRTHTHTHTHIVCDTLLVSIRR